MEVSDNHQQTIIDRKIEIIQETQEKIIKKQKAMEKFFGISCFEDEDGNLIYQPFSPK